jgi:anthranilate phosphoribosyltransferase
MSRSGSADVLSELGIKVAGDPTLAQTSLNGVGLCFLFAAKFHPSLRRLGDVRRSLGIRTCLNILGVMANPAPVGRHLVGVWHSSLVDQVARAFALLNVERAWVVHGSDGLDEITITGRTKITEVKGGKIRSFEISPKDFGFKSGPVNKLRNRSAKESAAIIHDVLASKRRDEARNIVVMNAAAALLIGDMASDPLHAARLAEQSIDSGLAQNKLDRLIQKSIGSGHAIHAPLKSSG